MSKVFVTTYEVIGAHEIAANHYAAVDTARKAHWEFVQEVGGCGYQPGRSQGVTGVLFDNELPPGWRAVGMENGKLKAVPNKCTKIGKQIQKRMRDLPLPPHGEKLCSHYGYNPSEFPNDGFSIYFATDVRVTLPTERIFLRIPRTASDGFEPNEAHLRELPESQFMAAVEAHNAEARRRSERTNGGAA